MTVLQASELKTLKAKLERGEQPTEDELKDFNDTYAFTKKFCADFIERLSISWPDLKARMEKLNEALLAVVTPKDTE